MAGPSTRADAGRSKTRSAGANAAGPNSAGPSATGPSSRERFLARQAERRRAERARWARPLTALAAALVLAGAGFWVVWSSPLLTAREVTVVGAHRLTAEQVRAAAEVPLGTPVARVDLVAIEARVRALPAVRAASASRSWPHTIRIAVEERRPAVAVPEQGRYLLVDFDAVVFETVAAAPAGVPRLRSNPAGLRAETVRSVVTVLEAVPEQVRRRISEVAAAGTDDVTLELTDGTRVIWGSAADSERKAQVLRELMRRPAAVYDVSAPAAPAAGGD